MYDSYSGFGSDGEDTGFLQKLQEQNVTKVYCCGLAYDYCVGSTAEDAAKNGLDTTIIMDATRSVMEDSKNAMKGRLDAVGVKEIASADL